MDEQALENLIIDNPAFEALDAAMNVFCPFEAVGMSRQEIRHGFFLEYVLDPARPHGFGAECLAAFMRAVATTLPGADTGIAPLDVHLMDLDGAIIRREYQAIDLIIEVPQEKLIVAVELKIDAVEHSGQLGRYRSIVEREWPSHRQLLLFLTKRGETPSGDGAGWHSLPLNPVVDAFSILADRHVGQADARMMLKAYVAMLRRDHVTDERMETLAKGLWREHREALEFLMMRRPDDRYATLGVLLARQSDVAKRVSELTGLDVQPDYATKSNIRFAIGDWDAYPATRTAEGWTASKRLILIEVKESGGVTKVQFELGPGEFRQSVFDALKAVGADIGPTHAIGNKFRQLANTSLAIDDENDVDEKFDAFSAGLADFISIHEAKYRAALSSVLT